MSEIELLITNELEAICNDPVYIEDFAFYEDFPRGDIKATVHDMVRRGVLVEDRDGRVKLADVSERTADDRL